MRTFFVGLLLLTIFCSRAQERCASAEYLAAQKSAGTFEAQNLVSAETFLQQRSTVTSTVARTNAEDIIRIPVVVHILYNNASQNLSDEQVKSQVDALNRDYRRQNADTLNTPERFRYLAADTHIEFYLATSDPAGRPTSGIIRKYTSIANWLTNDKIKSSSTNGDDAWDSKSYLNIWVGNLVSGAGYSSSPGSDGSKDGVVITTSAFGTIGRGGNYSKGRAAVHEVGHWLGLKHIWGDAQCGDDGIGDTPQQSWYTLDCPSGFRSSCSNGETGDMYMNYMDYTADACMNLFTEGQKRKMRAAFAEGGPRASILQSKGLTEASLSETIRVDNAVASNAVVFPNPATSDVKLNLGKAFVGKTIRLFNANGTLVQTVQITSALQTLSLTALKPGVYFIKGESLSQKLIKL